MSIFYIHHAYVVVDVMNIGNAFAEKSFDCVFASDLIEHLNKEDGLKLIAMMERIARKKVIIYTPNGFLPQGEVDNNPAQIHRSGWTVNEMKLLGYNRIIGINGWKPIRGELAKIRLSPQFIWERISLLSQPIVKRFPKYAFHILCIKDIV